MKKQIELNAWTDFQDGDQVVAIAPRHGTITVERDVPVEYKVGMALFTPDEFKEAPRGTVVIDKDGESFQKTNDVYWTNQDYYRNTAEMADEAHVSLFKVIYVGGTEVAEPKPVVAAKPAITRENFIKTMKAVVEDNMLDTGEEFNTVIVFAADRLGLY